MNAIDATTQPTRTTTTAITNTTRLLRVLEAAGDIMVGAQRRDQPTLQWPSPTCLPVSSTAARDRNLADDCPHPTLHKFAARAEFECFFSHEQGRAAKGSAELSM